MDNLLASALYLASASATSFLAWISSKLALCLATALVADSAGATFPIDCLLALTISLASFSSLILLSSSASLYLTGGRTTLPVLVLVTGVNPKSSNIVWFPRSSLSWGSTPASQSATSRLFLPRIGKAAAPGNPGTTGPGSGLANPMSSHSRSGMSASPWSS